MNGPAPRDEALLIDLVGRIMLTHAIDPAYAMRLLAIDRAEALGLIDIQRSQIMAAARWTKPVKWTVRRS